MQRRGYDRIICYYTKYLKHGMQQQTSLKSSLKEKCHPWLEVTSNGEYLNTQSLNVLRKIVTLVSNHNGYLQSSSHPLLPVDLCICLPINPLCTYHVDKNSFRTCFSTITSSLTVRYFGSESCPLWSMVVYDRKLIYLEQWVGTYIHSWMKKPF